MIFENVTMATGNVQIVNSRKFNLPPIKAEIEKILDEFEKGNIYTIPVTPVKISCSAPFIPQPKDRAVSCCGTSPHCSHLFNKEWSSPVGF